MYCKMVWCRLSDLWLWLGDVGTVVDIVDAETSEILFGWKEGNHRG